ncbi:MAG: MmgE/PrpD family protein [Desulfobacula sp.]|nr:MmgE/PrpD family protein [Desulfobacula sp.]
MQKWVTKTLVDYTMGTKFKDFPRRVIEKAKVLLLDNIGCSLGGSRSAIGDSVLTPFKRMGGSEEATLIGGGMKVPCIQAAFTNGTNANALDFDDAYLANGIGHPGSSIIPAALAVGEYKQATGKQILTAIITGYEVGNRIGLGIQPTHERLQKVWGVGTWQTFGAVVAAGKAMNLDTDQMFNAFGVAGATAPLPNTQKWGWDISERPIHWVKEPTGWPCWTGTLAATLAENGFIGNRYILDGENGFWIMAGSDQCDFDKMTAGLGKEYVVLNDMSFKPYSCCRWQHPALDCIQQIKQENKLGPDDIKEIIINSFSWVKSQEVYEPVSVIDAQFCIPYTSAMVIMGYKPGPGWYTQENLDNKEIISLARKVRVNVDPDLDKRYVQADELSARVEVITRKNESLDSFVKIPLGDPRNPLSMEEVEDKFRNQASYVLDKKKIDQAIQMILDFDNLDTINELMALLA